MEIVIELAEKYYTDIKESEHCGNYSVLYALDAIRNSTPLSDWLNSFDTNSATKCFEAVNNLKMKTAQEEMHEADERLLNSNWGDMEVRE